MALSPVVDSVTPFLNPGYANAWTPDIFWRLVLYWHGGIFIPWITVLAVLVGLAFSLDKVPGRAGRLFKESILYGGIFAAPIAGVAGIFDVFDHFALGIPLWLQIGAFLIGDEMAIALIVALLVYPRVSHKGFTHVGLPFYTIFLGVSGALVAAFMGHMGGWISWFGPSPQPFAQYINSTMYPVLGYYNDTAVAAFAGNVVGSHSHLMLISLMAGVVGLVGTSFGYMAWSTRQKAIARVGFAVMLGGLATAIGVYVAAGVGNLQIPAFFVSGANSLNGVAEDDMITGVVGFGAFFVLVAVILNARTQPAEGKSRLLVDPLFLSMIVAWVSIYLVIPITGFFINFNEEFFKTGGLSFDQIFIRFHQDFGFFLMPTLVTLVLALNAFGIWGKTRNTVGYLLLAGEAIAFTFGEAYTMVALSDILMYAAVFGGILIGLGAILGTRYLIRFEGGAERGPIRGA